MYVTTDWIYTTVDRQDFATWRAAICPWHEIMNLSCISTTPNSSSWLYNCFHQYVYHTDSQFQDDFPSIKVLMHVKVLWLTTDTVWKCSTSCIVLNRWNSLPQGLEISCCVTSRQSIGTVCTWNNTLIRNLIIKYWYGTRVTEQNRTDVRVQK